jgi:hypothetical protein
MPGEHDAIFDARGQVDVVMHPGAQLAMPSLRHPSCGLLLCWRKLIQAYPFLLVVSCFPPWE